MKAYDIDGILADFLEGFISAAKWNDYGYDDRWPQTPLQWDEWRAIPDKHFDRYWKLFAERDAFWRQLPVHPWIKGFESRVDADFYITARSVPTQVTSAWLQDNGFPNHNKVISVGVGESKLEAIRDLGVTHMLEDSFDHFSEINTETDATCYIVPRPNNIRKLMKSRIPNDLIITNPNQYIKL